MPSQLQTLVHSSLGIHSLLKKQPLKPNVIDRDKVAVPPNWDSWGKIRVLREGFDVEAVSEGWSIDLETKFPPPARDQTTENGTANGVEYDVDGYEITPGSAVTMFEGSVRNPTLDALQMAGRDTHSSKLEVETTDTQAFLGSQVEKLEVYKQKIEEEVKTSSPTASKKPVKGVDEDGRQVNVSDHIGPVQFNVGGIQVDADDMMKRLQVCLFVYKAKQKTQSILTRLPQDRQAYASSPEPEPVEDTTQTQQPIDPEKLQDFFTNLMNRKVGGSKS